jgi:hypothetical protein
LELEPSKLAAKGCVYIPREFFVGMADKSYETTSEEKEGRNRGEIRAENLSGRGNSRGYRYQLPVLLRKECGNDRKQIG